MERAKIVRIDVDTTRAGHLRATSRDLRGLHVVADDKAVLYERAREVIVALYHSAGSKVRVYEADPTEGSVEVPWVIVPVSN